MSHEESWVRVAGCKAFRAAVILFCVAGFAGRAGAQAPASTDSLPVRYEIDVTLNAEEKILEGHETLTWRNTGSEPTEKLMFHLYLNAFKNSLSTWALELGGERLWPGEPPYPMDYWGYMEIASIDLLSGDRIISDGIRAFYFTQTDDDNRHDETVLQVDLKDPVPENGEVKVRIGFVSKLPRGIGRTGWVPDYFFAAQWFPKLGVYRDGQWNCHQYHQNTEYFADFGHYQVTVTVPAGFIVGGSGRMVSESTDGVRVRHTFIENRIHDFAWVASPRFVEFAENFEQKQGPVVRVRLLVLPEHLALANRYLEATRQTLKFMGEWFGPYPYDHLTVVDPAHNSDSGGMEYPTLVTGGAHFLSPPESLSPEEVTIHEVGHQWWYGVVANNEFEEAWLDEGVNTWASARVARLAYAPRPYEERFFGGIPLVFPVTPIPFETESLADVRLAGRRANMVQESWTLGDSQSYVTNSYSKPAITLFTLERLLGEDVLVEALRRFYQRFQFQHVTTADLISVIEEASGQKLDWFFGQTFFSSDLLDYAVTEVRNFAREPAGVGVDTGSLGDEPYSSEVVVERLGAVRLPVEILVRFDDGTSKVEEWDGQESLVRFRYSGLRQVELAVVDPDRKLLLDVDPVNNSRYGEETLQAGFSSATWKWSLKWMFWLQGLLETVGFIG